MTKKDYDLIAACLGASKADGNDELTIRDITSRLIVELSLANPRFNSRKFHDRVEYWRKAHGGEAQ